MEKVKRSDLTHALCPSKCCFVVVTIFLGYSRAYSQKPSLSQATLRGAMPEEFEYHIKMRVHDYGGFRFEHFVLFLEPKKQCIQLQANGIGNVVLNLSSIQTIYAIYSGMPFKSRLNTFIFCLTRCFCFVLLCLNERYSARTVHRSSSVVHFDLNAHFLLS